MGESGGKAEPESRNTRGSDAGEGGGAADRKVAEVKERPDGLAERPKVT